MKNKSGLILAALLPLQYIGIKILAGFPEFVEKWYSLGLYPYLSKIMRYSLGFLPRAVAHNDFIFSVIAEEKGFLGSVMVIGLYSVLIFSGIKIAYQARDRLGKLLAVGVVTMLFSHIFINIGMNIRLMPVTGIPLPLLSYGGSSVLCSLIATAWRMIA